MDKSRVPARFLDHGSLFDDLAIESYRQTSGNRLESLVHQRLLDRGGIVLRRGWPDFCVIEDKRIFAVEVKSVVDILRPSQRAIMLELARMGIDTYLWKENPGTQGDGFFHPVGESSAWE